MTNITSSYTIKVYSVIMQSHYLDQPSERFAKGGGFRKKGPSEKELLVIKDVLKIRPFRANKILEQKASRLQ